MKNPAKANMQFLVLFLLLGMALYILIISSPASSPTGMAVSDSSQPAALDPMGGVVCRSESEKISMDPPVITSCRGEEDIDELLLTKGIVDENGNVLDKELLSNEFFAIGKSIFFGLYTENMRCNYRNCMLKCRGNLFEFPSINLAGLNKGHEIELYYAYYDDTEEKHRIRFGKWDRYADSS